MQTQIFPPKEVAMELKRVGFNEPCVGWYLENQSNESSLPYLNLVTVRNVNTKVNQCTAPTYDQVIGWFAEVHGMYMSLVICDDLNTTHYAVNVWRNKDAIVDGAWDSDRQQSLLTAFREAIKLIQKCQEEAK